MNKQELKFYAETKELITFSNSIYDKVNLKYISIYELFDIIKCGITKPIENPFDIVDFRKSIEEIRKEKDYEKQNELKLKNLPVFYSGGVINDGNGLKMGILSNTIFIDIDDYDFSHYEDIIEDLKGFPQVRCIFSTPRRKERIKVGILHNLEDENLFSSLYKDVSTKLNETFKEYKLKCDTSCSNSIKPIFFSYDSNIYINPEPETYYFVKEKKETISRNIETKEKETNNNEKDFNSDDNKEIISIDLKDGFTKYYTKNGYFKTKDIDKAIFDNFKYHYWNSEPFGKYEIGNRNNWVFKTSLELYKYIPDENKIFELYSNLKEPLDINELSGILSRTKQLFLGGNNYDNNTYLGNMRNYAISKVAKWKKEENISKSRTK